MWAVVGILLARLATSLPTGSATCFWQQDTITAMMTRNRHPGEPGGFTVTASQSTYLPGDTLTLTISGAVEFKGYLLYAEDSSTTRHGAFSANSVINIGSPMPSECQDGTTATHVDAGLKNNFALTWTAPVAGSGALTFRSLIYEGNDFWNALPLVIEEEEVVVPTASPTTEPVGGPCEDLHLVNNDVWHDVGGLSYTCLGWYAQTNKCDLDGDEYKFQNMTANDACCKCGGGTKGNYSLAGHVAYDLHAVGENCQADTEWTHPSYNDVCEDYLVGGKSHKWRCEPMVKAACCTCKPTTLAPTAVPVDGDKVVQCSDVLVNGMPWHDNGGDFYTCAYYQFKATACSYEGSSYAWGGMTATDACCTCGGGTLQAYSCIDQSQSNGDAWYDSGGEQYNCSYYSKETNCQKYKAFFENFGMTASTACCVCGGGTVDEPPILPINKNDPKPDEGDDITEEWFGGTRFVNKKHLRNGFVLYWNLVTEDTTSAPSGVPMTSSPITSSPTTRAPTAPGVTYTPTTGPTTPEPTYAPTTLEPTDAPTTSEPTDAPTTSPTTSSPTASPTNTISPTKTSAPTKTTTPTSAPSNAPTSTTSSPTDAPTEFEFVPYVRIGLLSPPNHQGWMAFGFSQFGGMTGSDVVAALFNDGSPVVADYHLKSQSQSALFTTERQEVFEKSLFAIGDRTGLLFSRPWNPTKGLHINPLQNSVFGINAFGKTSQKCSPFCNHLPTDRASYQLFLAAPPSSSTYLLNLGVDGDPCEGPASLECQSGYFCGDGNATHYGACF